MVLRVELNAEHGQGAVDYAFVGFIIGICEEGAPALREGVRVHSKPVVLAGDEASDAVLVHAGLVVSSVAVSD